MTNFRPTYNPKFSNYDSLIKYIRNQLRRYNLSSILNVALNRLLVPYTSQIHEMQAMPWLTALVAKVALEDKMISMENNPPCPISVFEACCGLIWNYIDQEAISEDYRLLLNARRSLSTQLLFQRSEYFSCLRWPALIARLPETHDLNKLFYAKFKMSPSDFMASAIALYRVMKHCEPHPVKISIFSGQSPEIHEKIRLLLTVFCKSPEELRQILSSELSARIMNNKPARFEHEPYESPWFSRYPLLRLQDNKIVHWSSVIFLQGIEQAVHERFSNEGELYTRSFSKIFEDYVIELISESGVAAITDNEFKKIGDASMPAVDALIPNSNGNVLIECKMSIYPDELLLSDKPAMIISKLKRIKKAVTQAWNVGDLLTTRKIDIADASTAPIDYLIIVVSRQIILANGVHIQTMLSDAYFENALHGGTGERATESQLRRLPPHHINILSIAEFEILSGAVKQGTWTYLGFAQAAAEAFSHPEGYVMTAEQILKRCIGPTHPSELLGRAWDDVTARLQANAVKHA